MAPTEREAASAQIAARVDELLASIVAAGGVLALYAAKGSEVDPIALDAHARARGLRVAYPRVVDGERQLAFHEATLTELVPSRLGLREPRADAPALALDAIAAFVVPGAAFDRTGGRIGWGRGHYDATLAAAPAAIRVGLGFDCQVIDAVPHDPHDALLHYLVTETAVYRTRD